MPYCPPSRCLVDKWLFEAVVPPCLGLFRRLWTMWMTPPPINTCPRFSQSVSTPSASLPGSSTVRKPHGCHFDHSGNGAQSAQGRNHLSTV